MLFFYLSLSLSLCGRLAVCLSVCLCLSLPVGPCVLVPHTMTMVVRAGSTRAVWTGGGQAEEDGRDRRAADPGGVRPVRAGGQPGTLHLLRAAGPLQPQGRGQRIQRD